MKNIAVLGATGLVGEEVIKILETRNYPVRELLLFASERSEGQTISFKDREVEILTDHKDLISNADIIFGCLDAPLAREIIPTLSERSIVIDNSNAFRMDPEVPLIIPEINPEKIREHKGIIANPNCSTIQMLVPLFPLHKKARVKRIFVATYQSVSGAGKEAIDELRYEFEQLSMEQAIEKADDAIFTHPIGNNIIPQIGSFDDHGYTSEEMKMVNETRKIFNDDSIQVTSTCVRIPVFIGHSEALSVEFENYISPAEAIEILKSAPGVKVFDKDDLYPMPVKVAGTDAVFVGRIRKDLVFENGLALWIVADNVRKGAALNAVQIAELLL
ncbi:MAG: aspartate-semialdehyde dehydrogenase [bacterium]